jgi:glycosyltransferase involved in cell wall biosynthesis
VQAFLDLGFEVEFVFIRTRDNLPSSPGYFKQLNCTIVDARSDRASCLTRLAYWAGWPGELALRQLYPARKAILRAALSRIRKDPSAIHVFHYLQTANVIPRLPAARTLWACHDIESEFLVRDAAIDEKREKRQPYGWESRKLRRVSDLERAVACASGLVACVAPEDAKQIVEEWRVPRAAYLPISITNGDNTVAAGAGRAAGHLRLLHVGALDLPANYSSLEFLFTRVFPLLDAETLSQLKIEAVGTSAPGGARTNAIMEMARPYPMVRFSGFVEDIRTAYARNDLQVVASTKATGRRSRIIESWAYGLPVLCTTVAAGGVRYLEPGRNILIADDPRDFARILKELIDTPNRLNEIAVAARQTYDAKFGRQAVAGALRELLNTYFALELPPVAVGQGVSQERTS